MNVTAMKPAARLAGVIICLICATTAFGQFRDWKGQAIETKLKRKRPPEVYLHGTAVKLEINSTIHRGRDYRAQIQSRLESGLFAQDSRLRPGNDTIIVCNITRLDADDGTWLARKATERKKVGEQQIWNPKKSRNETENIYKDVEVTRRYRIVKGGINISYKALDARSRKVLDAQNIEESFSKEYSEETAAPAEYEVCEGLINQAVDRIVLRLAVTAEEIKVMLPRGKSENFSKLGQAGLWEKMYEGLDKMGEIKKLEDEAYRRFGLGIADEAKAYAAADPKQTWDHLMEASSHYNKAIELKADEKYFRDPLKRIEQAIEQYRKIAGQKEDYAKSLRPAATPKPVAPPPDNGAKSLSVKPNPPPAASAPAMTNQHVIDLVKSGLDEANLIATIKAERAVAFDLGFAGMKELRDNQVPINVITAMRARQNARPPASRRKK